MKITSIVKIVAVISLMLMVVACESNVGTIGPIKLDKSLTLVPYESCAELENEVKEILIGEMERNLDEMKGYCMFGYKPAAFDAPAEEDSAGDVAEAQTTGTNLQEEGVDEADLVKSDGKYAYALVGEQIQIVRVWPFGEFRLESTIPLEGQPKGLYLTENKLVVLTVKTIEPAPLKILYYPLPVEAKTLEKVYDVSDPVNPQLIQNRSYDGNLLSSRRVNSKLYLILDGRGVVYPEISYALDIDYTQYPECMDDDKDTVPAFVESEVEKLKAKNRKIIEDATLAELVPDLSTPSDEQCKSIMRGPSSSGLSFLKIVMSSIEKNSGDPSVTVVFGNGGSVYASTNNLFITSTHVNYGWWSVPAYVFEDATVIHRFAIDEDKPTYSGSIKVEGHLVNNSYAGSRYSSRFSMSQFAMSEYEDNLRIATTYNEASTLTFDDVTMTTFELDNRVYVIAISNSGLEKIGEVTGLGKDERIYAVRFIRDKGYVVTFKKVDPLYVVDLSVPTAPMVAGELKIPGFSTYLHPLDDNYLIGLGFGADDEVSFAWTQGLKLALFDVSNPANPFEVGHREIGTRGSYSVAIEEHHAFTLDTSRDLLALPVDIYEGGSGGSDFGTLLFTGVMLFNADQTGNFETVGQIEVAPSTGGEASWWWPAESEVLRTIIIGDESNEGIITLTKQGVLLNKIDSAMTEVGRTF